MLCASPLRKIRPQISVASERPWLTRSGHDKWEKMVVVWEMRFGSGNCSGPTDGTTDEGPGMLVTKAVTD